LLRYLLASKVGLPQDAGPHLEGINGNEEIIVFDRRGFGSAGWMQQARGHDLAAREQQWNFHERCRVRHQHQQVVFARTV
jgi:hypothetical protein